MNITILVATHKRYWMPSDKIYLPLHVGAEGKAPLPYTPDNTGENISSKNPNYCEITGLYWAWKNLTTDYIGLCHYRRYLGKRIYTNDMEKKKAAIFRKADYEALLATHDIILPKKRCYYIETVRNQYEHAHFKEDLDEVEQIIAEKYPDYSDAFRKVMGRRSLRILNMFVMKKSLFDEYAEWLFDILFAAEKKIDLSQRRDYQARIFGFLAERLFNVWLEKKQLRVAEAAIISLESIHWGKKITRFLMRKFLR